ncbi:DUF4375 domain-containing protein [Flavobacterium endoglycinae]|uniref:DUF4375 domain-containing protein n=1 Tax=Flavobacterium endoglycinae TaxID=2816357 RepID=A0ABX7QIL5_9FLAO|nr:DUF4375 domain-containing protein [Flavobacterium endoglycinae]QSW90917.1 DUF4375 domain-containing protein [Flavobacterium endoglycinae]
MEEKDKQRQQFEDYSFEVVDKLFKIYDGKIEAMPENERDVVLIWRLEADMYNGGFVQYFCNWGFNNFEDTQKVLAKINAKQSLNIITECEQIISVLQDDDRIEALWDIPKYLPEYLSEEQDARLEELDEMYWKNLDDILLIGYNYYLKK